MQLGRFQVIVLFVAGFTALLIGAYIALDPKGFYSSYGIALEGNPDMLSELRAQGTNLAVLGTAIVAGALRASIRQVAIAVSLMVFMSFSVGRTLSLLLDGPPSQAVIVALLIEVAIAALCVAAFMRRSVRSYTDCFSRHQARQ